MDTSPISELTTSHWKHKSGVAGYAPQLYQASLLCTIMPCGIYTILQVHTLMCMHGPCFPGLFGTQLFQRLGQHAHHNPQLCASPLLQHTLTLPQLSLASFCLFFFSFPIQITSPPSNSVLCSLACILKSLTFSVRFCLCPGEAEQPAQPKLTLGEVTCRRQGHWRTQRKR